MTEKSKSKDSLQGSWFAQTRAIERPADEEPTEVHSRAGGLNTVLSVGRSGVSSVTRDRTLKLSVRKSVSAKQVNARQGEAAKMGGTAEMFRHFSSRMRMNGVYFYLWSI